MIFTGHCERIFSWTCDMMGNGIGSYGR
jgi:hypothetical protein